MSIIQEALKKAQSDVKMPDVRPDIKPVRKVEDARPIVKPVAQKNGKKPAVKKNVLMVAALSALVAIAIFSARQFLSKADNISNNTNTMPTQEVSYRPIIKPEVKTPNTIAGQGQLNTATGIRKMRDRPNLILNGIMYIEESPRAIVNNSIVEAGDSVSGAKVMKINRQSVILEYENVEITLNLK